MRRTIYLLEDDDNIRELVVYTLNSAGLTAEGFATPSVFWEAVKKEMPGLVLLDIMLPEEDGLSVLRKLRSAPNTKRIPVILLTAKSSEFDKVIGLDGGADDYISKPFGMMELLARVRALLRRTASDTSSGRYVVGELTVDTSAHEVCVGGEPISLTLKEFELLCLLLENRSIVLTRDRLLDTVWGYAFDGESRTVDVHIRSLRQKLGKSGDCIETVRGVGYKVR